jgi:hypothetical protein
MAVGARTSVRWEALFDATRVEPARGSTPARERAEVSEVRAHQAVRPQPPRAEWVRLERDGGVPHLRSVTSTTECPAGSVSGSALSAREDFGRRGRSHEHENRQHSHETRSAASTNGTLEEVQSLVPYPGRVSGSSPRLRTSTPGHPGGARSSPSTRGRCPRPRWPLRPSPSRAFA